MLRRTLTALGLAVSITAATLVGIASPASAAPNTVPTTYTNTATGTVFNRTTVSWHPTSNINRTATYLIGVQGTSSGYVWVMYVEDLVDVGVGCSGCVSDSEGQVHIQWHYCDNSTPWTNVIWDWDSAAWQYNDSQNGYVWTSPTWTAAANGHPSDVCTRVWATTRYQLATFQWVTSNFYYPSTTGNSWYY